MVIALLADWVDSILFGRLREGVFILYRLYVGLISKLRDEFHSQSLNLQESYLGFGYHHRLQNNFLSWFHSWTAFTFLLTYIVEAVDYSKDTYVTDLGFSGYISAFSFDHWLMVSNRDLN